MGLKSKNNNKRLMGITERIFKGIKVSHIVIFGIILYSLALNANLSTNGDDSRYILISRAFLEKGVLNQIFFSDLIVSTGHYFMLPLLLLPFSFSENFILMKLIPLLSTILSIFALNEFLKGIVKDTHRKMILILYVVNPWVIEYSGLILTEMPYILFSLCTLTFFKKYLDNGKNLYLLLSIIFLGFSLYTRPFGLAFLPAFFLFFLIRKRWKELVFFFAVILIITIPILYNAMGLFSAYSKDFIKKQQYYSFEYKEAKGPEIMYRIGYNFLAYTGNYLPDIMARPVVSRINPRLPDRTINPFFPLKFLMGTLLGGIILIGFIKTFRAKMYLYHLYLFFHIMINLVINVYVARYIFSLLPFILLFLFEGINHKTDMASGREGRRFFGREKFIHGLFLFFFSVSIIGTIGEIVNARTGYVSPEVKVFVECNDWVKDNTPRSSIVLSRKPTYTKVYTGRDAIGYIFSDNVQKQLTNIVENGVDYVIVEDLGFYLDEEKYILNTVKNYPEKFLLVYSTESLLKNYVFQVIRKR